MHTIKLHKIFKKRRRINHCFGCKLSILIHLRALILFGCFFFSLIIISCNCFFFSLIIISCNCFLICFRFKPTLQWYSIILRLIRTFIGSDCDPNSCAIRDRLLIFLNLFLRNEARNLRYRSSSFRSLCRLGLSSGGSLSILFWNCISMDVGVGQVQAKSKRMVRINQPLIFLKIKFSKHPIRTIQSPSATCPRNQTLMIGECPKSM